MFETVLRTVVFLQKQYSVCKYIHFCEVETTTQDTLDAVRGKAIAELNKHRPVPSPWAALYRPVKPIDSGELVKTLSELEDQFQLNQESFRTNLVNMNTKELERHEGILILVFEEPLIGHSPEAIAERQETEHLPSREDITKGAQNRQSPSSGAKLDSLKTTQNVSRPDAIYNSRPLTLQPPPISIYHPVFAKFTQLMATPYTNMDFSYEELEQAIKFIASSLPFYEDEKSRQDSILGLASVASGILTSSAFNLKSGMFSPDGVCSVECPVFTEKYQSTQAVMGIQVLESEVGTGGCDPAAQAECAYVAICSSDEVASVLILIFEPLRQVSCCPAFLVGIAGPYITVAGAVFADHFISERLTDYIFIGPKPTLDERSSLDEGARRIAQLLRTLTICFQDLKLYYSQLRSPPRYRKSRLPSSPSPFPPHFKEYSVDNITYTLKYIDHLAPFDKQKAVFKAIATSTTKTKTVVVKFTPRYGSEGHRLLAAAKPRPLAPQLYFCEKAESVGMYVVIMEFIEDCPVRIPMDVAEASQVRTAMETLHKADLVFGDLRQPNLVQTQTGIMLLDFDWCGKTGEVRYPGDVFLDGDVDWHEGVRRGGLIRKEHDMHMLSCLEDHSS
ncbi:hypothetical protein BDN70DRAFT_897494 [Pholiota conissans]|uniref:Protein kinase domain-containing protein n=1 Tax=Pholiota conissans TaxID=109636 RepID=A0A9P6CX35_9AGAR|nr:hypothetical protein BDN70DRAFT_897494 [Pholiota conissans]